MKIALTVFISIIIILVNYLSKKTLDKIENYYQTWDGFFSEYEYSKGFIWSQIAMLVTCTVADLFCLFILWQLWF